MPSYRTHFATPELAEQYEREIFSEETYGTLLTPIEVAFVADVVRRLKAKPVDYLDFACGSGRMISRLEPLMGSTTGIEISDAMLEIASRRVTKAKLIHTDVTAPGTPIEGKYDLITAFRFFLNAEEDLRRLVIKQLAARLADEDSRLVFNIHGTPSSYRGGLWLVDQVRRRLRGGGGLGVRVVSHAHVVRLLASAGLEVEQVYGYGVLSGYGARLLGRERAYAIEQKLAGSGLGGWLGSLRLYVARPARGKKRG